MSPRFRTSKVKQSGGGPRSAAGRTPADLLRRALESGDAAIDVRIGSRRVVLSVTDEPAGVDFDAPPPCRRWDFGPRFVELARSVCRHNDRRSALKRAVNESLGSRFVEEKSYGERG